MGTSRREVVLILAAAFAASRSLCVLAQSKREPLSIAWFDYGRREAGLRNLGVFKEALAALGWQEGMRIAIDDRWANGDNDRVNAIAAELAARKPALVVVTTLRIAAAVTKAAPNTPVVQTGGANPVSLGLATSFARPGKMLTGLTSITGEVSGKYFELLLAAAPAVRRVAVLVDGNAVNLQNQMKALQHAAAIHALDARFMRVASAESIESTLAEGARQGVQALVTVP